MKRYICIVLLGIMTMLGHVNPSFAASVATSFQLPMSDYPVDDGCRQWMWYGDFDGDGDSEYHLADDVCASAGTKVYAVANGTVMYADSYTDCPNWEYLIIIEHTLSDGSVVNSIYGHIAPLDGISAGTIVTEGQYIGDIVSMDCWDSHIHFGVYVGPFTDIACYGPGNCKTAGYGSSTGNYTDPVAFVEDHQSTTCIPTETETTAPVNMVAILPDTEVPDSNAYDLTSYYQSTSGQPLTLYGKVGNDTGKVATNLGWLVGNVTNDTQADLVEITVNDTNTFANVYKSSGDGGFYQRTQWRRTAKPAQYALLGDFNGDKLEDLILGYGISGSTKMQWKVCTSSGTAFNVCIPWKESFGYSGDKFIAGDFDGNGKVELLNGHDPDGATNSDCTNLLTWKRLNSVGKVITVYTGWGYGASQYLVGNIDGNGVDGDVNAELVEIRTCSGNDITPAYVADFANPLLTWKTMASDVGKVNGMYGLFDVTGDVYPDLTRWSTTRLA